MILLPINTKVLKRKECCGTTKTRILKFTNRVKEYNLNLFHLSCLSIWQHQQGPCHMTYRVPVRLSWNINSGLVTFQIYFVWWWVDSLPFSDCCGWRMGDLSLELHWLALLLSITHSVSSSQPVIHSASVLLFCIHNNTTCWYPIYLPLSIFTQDAAHSAPSHHMLDS